MVLSTEFSLGLDSWWETCVQRHGNKKKQLQTNKCFCRCICCTVSKSAWTVVPWQGAASTQPLVLYVAPENILWPLEENWKCHTRDVSLLWGGHLVAEGKLQQRLKTHFGKLLPHPHIDLCLCWKTSILHFQHLADVTLLSDLQHNECTQGVLLSCSKYEEFDRSHCCWWTTGSAFATMPGYSEISPTILTSSWPPCCLIKGTTAILPVNDGDCEWMEPLFSIAMIWPTKSLGMKLANGKISVLISWTT